MHAHKAPRLLRLQSHKSGSELHSIDTVALPPPPILLELFLLGHHLFRSRHRRSTPLVLLHTHHGKHVTTVTLVAVQATMPWTRCLDFGRPSRAAPLTRLSPCLVGLSANLDLYRPHSNRRVFRPFSRLRRRLPRLSQRHELVSFICSIGSPTRPLSVDRQSQRHCGPGVMDRTFNLLTSFAHALLPNGNIHLVPIAFQSRQQIERRSSRTHAAKHQRRLSSSRPRRRRSSTISRRR